MEDNGINLKVQVLTDVVNGQRIWDTREVTPQGLTRLVEQDMTVRAVGCDTCKNHVEFNDGCMLHGYGLCKCILDNYKDFIPGE